MSTVMEKNVSIVIPTYREAKNIGELIKRIANTHFGDREFEVILVDDNSQDGIVEIVNNLALQYSWLKIIIRKEPRSLSLAVMDGFKNAKYPLLVCMDADLSHPPEKIPAMLAALENADFVIGSRYISGGSTDEVWPVSRKFFSRVAAAMANLLIFADGRIKDPLSGFCALRKSMLCTGAKLNPIGWKIGLELMIKLRCKTICEIPIHFSERHHGVSKLSGKVVWGYLRHLQRLIWFKMLRLVTIRG